MKIGDREIGPGHPAYVIAEIGVNHDGALDRALQLVDDAATAGADAVKLQCFEARRLMSRASRLAAYQAAAGERDPVEMLSRLELSLDDMARVVERAHDRAIHAIVTVFSVELVAPASTLAWDAYKSASPDIINRPLLDAMGTTGKPLIVSTGAAAIEEVVRAAKWLRPLHDRLAFLQCVSCYPTPPGREALEGIDAIGLILQEFGIPVGYSDHTESEETGNAAVAWHGATILEKHLTHDRGAVGPDHSASLDPGAFARYVALVRRAEQLGDRLAPARWSPSAEKRVLDCEWDVRTLSRQSIVTTREIRDGEPIEREDLTIKRPGTGIEPFRMDEVIGRRAAKDIEPDVPLTEDDIS